jgi:pimeloyl-ACP methyl ester carboxylesterase
MFLSKLFVFGSFLIALLIVVGFLDQRPWWLPFATGVPLLLCVGAVIRDGFQWTLLPVAILNTVLLLGVLGVSYLLPMFRLPDPTGPMAVGTLAQTWVDADRNGRKVPVQMWYPAEPDPSAPRAAYLSDAKEQVKGLPVPAFLLTHLEHVQTQSVLNARVLHSNESYPVLLFSHGVGGNAAQNTVQFQELASHGYVVVSIDHSFSFEAYNINPRTMTMDSYMEVLEQQVLPVQVADQRFVVDQLERIHADDPAGRLTDVLDLDRVGVFGHSGGGSTGLQFCSGDARCKAMLNLDGNVLGRVRHTGIAQPYLHISQNVLVPLSEAEVAAIQPNVRPLALDYRQGIEDLLRVTPDQASWIRLQHSGHFTFTDAPLMFPVAVGPLRQMMGSIDGARAQQVLNTYTRAFFDAHLKGIASPLLRGPAPEYPEMQWITGVGA